MSKVFLIDVAKCSGCHSCQVSCKDEHCEQSWLPYAAAQPLTGQFWCRVDEKERGVTPVVTVSYTPIICGHCEHCVLEGIGGDAVQRREDGLVLIDPEKAKGRRDLVDACPLGAVYWNEELELPQKCTGCAHLLDDGWSVPRCVDSCAHKAIQYAEPEELDLEGAEFLPEIAALGPRVYYKNLAKRFAAGNVYDNVVNDIIEGAQVTLLDEAGAAIATTQTDWLGDWRFNQIEAARYTVRIAAEGYKVAEVAIDVTEKDQVVNDLALTYEGDEATRGRNLEPVVPPRNLHSKERAEVTYEEEEEELPSELGTNIRIVVLAKIPQAAAVIDELMPGFLSNTEVMSKVGAYSFDAVSAMAPDMVPPTLMDAMNEKLRAIQL